MRLFDTIMRRYLAVKHRSVHRVYQEPHVAQRAWFDYLMKQGRRTTFGAKWNFENIYSPAQFAEHVPIYTYDDLQPYIHRVMAQERDVLWPGQTKWFAQSSGTTADRSKYIPVTLENLKSCHVKGFTDAMSMIYDIYADADVFTGRSMTLGGAMRYHEQYPQALVGDVSAIVLAHMHAVGQHFYALDKSVAFMTDWEVKLEQIAQSLIHQKNITLFGGVPTWNIVLFRRMLEITGAPDMTAIWPRAKIYVHGGVGFKPYKKQFQSYFPRPDFLFQEIYNASEGFFAAQDDLLSDDLLLMLDSGIYYEFVPISVIQQHLPIAIPLSQVQEGQKYALVITTNAGLWRYMPGDVVEVTQTCPYKIKMVGRTKHFINAFGEEVIIDNSDRAIAAASRQCKVSVADYTVAPIYFEHGQKAHHEWAIEFMEQPEDIGRFTEILDQALQAVNSDYQAKRYKNLALIEPKINIVPKGTFHRWMKKQGKYGAQNKIPRLSNSRQYIDQILSINT